ncbi:Mur ligase family protein [Gammaproteobacteria bacterium]|nr:Mur ligase family protein [Gammaproteobacteria bacterium]
MDIPELESEQLIVDSCRRLTGPSLVWSEPGAILDILIQDMDMEAVLECWYRQLQQLLADVDWGEPRLTHRRFENGYNLLLAAPIDQLYSAVLALETAWYFSACELLEQAIQSRGSLLEALRSEMLEERAPALIEIENAAARHDVDFLVDDETISLGHGIGSRSYPIDQIPSPDAVDWSVIHNLPVAMITGTNGKSTSVRLLDGIASSAGQVSGVTSTDFVRVGAEVLDHGDYSGPGGARLLLRDSRLEVAFLEVARGGILRRGLPLRRARAALVTNIAADHLGQYGVNTLAALAETKFAVARTLADDGTLIANADDNETVDFLATRPQPRLCWFSLDKSNLQIQRQLSLQQACCFCDKGKLIYFDATGLTEICAINAVPMTLQGAALHNVSNALGAIGVARAMGYTAAQISTGLQRFHSDSSDNPGRMNYFRLHNSARVIIDFAHNEHGVSAIVDTVGRMPARKKWALFGSAGDRSDEHIAAIARGACTINPDHVVITELADYLRGRSRGEVTQIMKQACLQSGIEEKCIHLADSPIAGVKLALAEMQADDLGLFLVLSQRDQIINHLKSQSS